MPPRPQDARPGAHGGGWIKPWKPGQSGNPAGRKRAGASELDWINILFQDDDLTESDLRKIVADDTVPTAKRLAARTILLMMAPCTVADFAPWLNGEKSMEELKRAGVDIGVVKRAVERRVSRHLGDPEVVSREIVMHDQGTYVWRILDACEKAWLKATNRECEP